MSLGDKIDMGMQNVTVHWRSNNCLILLCLGSVTEALSEPGFSSRSTQTLVQLHGAFLNLISCECSSYGAAAYFFTASFQYHRTEDVTKGYVW